MGGRGLEGLYFCGWLVGCLFVSCPVEELKK